MIDGMVKSIRIYCFYQFIDGLFIHGFPANVKCLDQHQKMLIKKFDPHFFVCYIQQYLHEEEFVV